MSSFFPKNDNHSKMNSGYQAPTFKNALNSIDDNDQYQFAPHVQQYDFKPFTPRQESKPNKRSDIHSSSQVQDRQSMHIPKKQSSNMNQLQNQLINTLKSRVNSLQKQNMQLKKDKQGLTRRIQNLQKQIQTINKLRKSDTKIQKPIQNDYQLHSSKSKSNLRKGFSKQNFLVNNSSGSSKQKTFLASPVLLKQLLLQCNQSRQFDQISAKKLLKPNNSNYKENANLNWEKDEFYQYKDTKDCFAPFFQNLSRQLQLRCKKAMIRDKQLVYKDDSVEIGCISKKISDHEFEINVIITNIMNKAIKNINVAYLHKGDIQVAKQVKSTNIGVQKSTKSHTIYSELNSAQQIKQSLCVLTQSVDFRCILINLEFADYKGQTHNISQILPGCKHRLFNYLVSTPIPQTYIVVEKLVIVDKKFLPELQKLKSYYKPILFTTDRNKNVQAVLKIQFISKQFFVCFKLIGSDKLTIGVYHMRDQSQSAQKILGQFIFLFEK